MLHETNGYYIATMNQYAYVKEPYDPIIKSLPVVACPFHYEFGLVKEAENGTLRIGRRICCYDSQCNHRK